MIPYKTFPVLLDLGFIKIFSYGLFTALAFIVALYFARQSALKRKFPENHVYNLVFIAMISGILSARLYYVIQFGGNFFKIWDGGIVYYGGLIGATVSVLIYTIYHKLNILRMLDVLSPALAIGHGIGRIGCFVNGCCFGLETSAKLPWSVFYLEAARHPTQLYSVIGNFSIFGILKWLERQKSKDGFIVSIYFMLYGLFRFSVEFFRAHDDSTYLFNLYLAQWISLGVMVIGISMLVYVVGSGKKRKK